MPINLTVFEKDLRAVIRDIPVTVKFNNRIYKDAAISSQGSDGSILEGGLLESTTGTITIVKSDIIGRQPKHRDDIYLRLKNGKWLHLEVKNAPDEIDPNSVSVTLIVGSPEN